ncbi:CHAD domain-containing protein [Sneathiella sp.]|jgi:CHAD domain-containing protein|uniref:CHAD domain-containing protein n=1 Tax=Sneathiella sp. TaxID=1964365 RepID=UPI0039E44CE6
MVTEKRAGAGNDRPEDAYKLPPLDLRDATTVEAAARRIFKECSVHLRTNFERFVVHEDEPSLMQIRIGMRRTRVAMRVFRQIIHPEVLKNFSREYKYFGRLLGEARDMDVFLRGILSEDCPLDGLEDAYEELRHHALIMREKEYKLIAVEIRGGRFAMQLENFDNWRNEDWSKRLGRTGQKILSAAVREFALEVIEDGRQEMLSRGASIEELSTQELHKVRKFIKRSRYHLRFFASLIAAEKRHQGYDILVKMQDSLGHVNDVKEALRLMGILGGEVRADHIANILLLIAEKISEAGEEVQEHLSEFTTLWHRYEEFVITQDDLLPS